MTLYVYIRSPKYAGIQDALYPNTLTDFDFPILNTKINNKRLTSDYCLLTLLQ